MSILFAATFPDHVRSLVLYGTAARFTQELPDFPWGWSPRSGPSSNSRMSDKHWGEGVLCRL